MVNLSTIVALIVAILAIMISFLPDLDVPICLNKLDCNDIDIQIYDIKPVSAPNTTSLLLKIFSFIATRTKIGPPLRRFLLNDNGSPYLRALASQISLPPLHFPVRRVENINANDEEFFKMSLQYLNDGINEKLSPVQNSQFRHKTIMDYATEYREHKTLPSIVMKRILKKINQWENEDFNIFSSVLHDDVMQMAYASDERHNKNESLSIFDGVPIAVKDMIRVKGHYMYIGKSPLLEHKEVWGERATKDDTIVARFKAAGAIVLGTTIMTEGGVTPLGYNAHFHGPVSAYSPSHYSGGSSSGSAVAVASGLVPVAIGFDGGGSIRIPASCSGLHGLAATFNRIPYDSSTDSTMIKAGPIAGSALDAALTYLLISPDSEDKNHISHRIYGAAPSASAGSGPPVPHIAQFNEVEDLSGVRLGVFADWNNDSHVSIREICEQAIAYLQSRGATVVPIFIPHLQRQRMAHALKISTEFALGWDKTYYKKPFDLLEPNTRIILGIGASVTALEALAADKIRAWSFDYVTNLFERENLTAIVSPSISIPPPYLNEAAKVNGESNTALTVEVMKYIFLANFLGLPGYTVPVGFVHAEVGEGVMLPVGLHLLGNHWSEHELLRLAHALELGFSKTLKPQQYFNPLADDSIM